MATINIIKQNGVEGRNDLALPVSVNGMLITVGSGDFHYCGEALTLSDDAEYVVTPDATYDTVLLASLVKGPAPAFEVSVVVDEVLQDGADRPFDLNDSEYQTLGRLFSCSIPAGATSLDDVTISVRQVVPREIVEKQPNRKTGSQFVPKTGPVLPRVEE